MKTLMFPTECQHQRVHCSYSSAEHFHTSIFSEPPSLLLSPLLHHLTGKARAWDDKASGLRAWAFQRGPGGIVDYPLSSRKRGKTLCWPAAVLRNVMLTISRGIKDNQAAGVRMTGPRRHLRRKMMRQTEKVDTKGKQDQSQILWDYVSNKMLKKF